MVVTLAMSRRLPWAPRLSGDVRFAQHLGRDWVASFSYTVGSRVGRHRGTMGRAVAWRPDLGAEQTGARKWV